MTSFGFFWQAYWEITNDWRKTFRLTIGPWMVVKICTVLFNIYYFGRVSFPSADFDSLPFGPSLTATFVLPLLEMSVAVWIAVAWHRYIILRENPNGYLPKWFGILNRKYLFRLLWVSFIVVVPVMASMIVLYEVFDGLPFMLRPSGEGVIFYGFMFLASVISFNIFLRIGIILPALATQRIGGIPAMKRAIRTREAWRLTKPVNAQIFGCAVALALAGAAIEVPGRIFDGFDAIALVMIAARGFYSLLVLSLLTTIYRHVTSAEADDMPPPSTQP